MDSHTGTYLQTAVRMTPLTCAVQNLGDIMCETLDDHHNYTSSGGRLICSLCLEDNLLAGTNTELQDLTNRVTNACGSESSVDKL